MKFTTFPEWIDHVLFVLGDSAWSSSINSDINETVFKVDGVVVAYWDKKEKVGYVDFDNFR